jgi:ribosomal peptide maturation radical SAM protein 1
MLMSENAQDPVDIMVISMPWAPLGPSIQLGILHSLLLEMNLTFEVMPIYLDYYAYLKATGLVNNNEEYDEICSRSYYSEWIFTCPDFEGTDSSPILVIPPNEYSRYQRLKEATPHFIENLAIRIATRKPKIVAFSLVYGQSVSSLVLSKMIKKLSPRTIILFGGTACAGGIGDAYLTNFNWIDAVYYGDAEGGLPGFLVELLINRDACSDLVSTRRRDGSIHFACKYNQAQGDEFTTPDFREYFSLFNRLGLSDIEVKIPFEGSRGCWWAEKKSCSFCGLNPDKKFRRKPVSKIVNEIEMQASKFNINQFQATDNILDYRDEKEFTSRLMESRYDFRIFYEVRSHLGLQELIRLKRAGVFRVQAGIESLCTDVLQRMHKGVRAIQNVRLLKFCSWLGIQCDWNILTGFNGESALGYEQMVRLIRQLHHLEPPNMVGPYHLHRGSRIFDSPEEHGVSIIGPSPAYHSLYPVTSDILNDLAFDFLYTRKDGQNRLEYTRALVAAVVEWKQIHRDKPSSLRYYRLGEKISIHDERKGRKARYLLNESASLIYQKCVDIITIEKLLEDVSEFSVNITRIDIEELAADLEEEGLIMREGEEILALALPAQEALEYALPS